MSAVGSATFFLQECGTTKGPFSVCVFPVPRFLFLLLGPHGKGPQYHEIGRSMATLMTDEVRPRGLTLKKRGQAAPGNTCPALP